MANIQSISEKSLRGVAASAGVCQGQVFVIQEDERVLSEDLVDEGQEKPEVDRFEKALVKTRQDLKEVQRRVMATLGAQEANIFEAHLLVLEDPVLMDAVIKRIQTDRHNAEFAFDSVASEYIQALIAIDDDYLKERAADLKDITQRVIDNLQGVNHDLDLSGFDHPVIIISHDLTPSVTAQLDKEKVLGFGTDIGGRTSHSAIMARSLGIPAVTGIGNATDSLTTGDHILLDGYNGTLILSPSDQILFEYGQLVERKSTLTHELKDLQELPAVTLDGVQIDLRANIETPKDSSLVIENGAHGVGLFRTEYLFIQRPTLPSEDEQFEAYKSVAEALAPNAVDIRTVDIGGDKMLSHLDVPEELNPFLGWRAIRYCLQERDMFRNQLRAILRASAFGNIRMMYPMISGIEEFLEAGKILEACKTELREAGIAFNEDIEVGVVIEIPSAVLTADTLAKHAKFFSIGTNDLLQYTLAVDRMNEKIAHLYQPTHPGVLRLIQMTVKAGDGNKISTAVCGEMAAEATLVPLLLGLGVDSLSVAAPLVPQTKHLIRKLSLKDAQALAEECMALECSNAIQDRVTQFTKDLCPELF